MSDTPNRTVMKTTTRVGMPVDKYEVDGVHTCAMDFETGKVCIFLRTVKFGCQEICGLSNTLLLREGIVRTGWLVPNKNCPLRNEALHADK